MTIEFKTIHDLPFEVAEWEWNGLSGDNWQRFRVGTCEGIWRCQDDAYEILAIDNKVKGNGHFEDVLQWFYNSCIRDKKNFKIREVWNQKLKAHLINKRGFKPFSLVDVQKTYKAIKKEFAAKSITQ
jgi:hypothetical protein